MDFGERPEHAAFRGEARSWLESVSGPAVERAVPQNAIVAEWGPDEEHDRMRAARDWQRTKFDAGWAGVSWPTDVGGRGCGPIEAIIFSQEEAQREVPRGELAVGLGWLGPTITAVGTHEQRLRFLPPMLRGDEVWCQLFSEPGAGSDLAALATVAERDGDVWRLTGQKVWSTFAHMSDWGLCLARTDPDVPKHKGITAFVVDMHERGVECRPLRQMTGAANFNEVFLDGVIVADAQRIGDVGAGWATAMTTFVHERSGGGTGSEIGMQKLIRLVQTEGRASDPIVRQRVASVYCRARALEFTGQRLLSTVMAGRMPGPEASTLKLAYTNMMTEMLNVALAVQGPAGVLAGDQAPLGGGWQSLFLGMPGIRVGGGTDEVQRNIIGERALRLPGDVRVDKNVPFRDIPR